MCHSLFIVMYYLQYERPCCIGYTNSGAEGESLYVRYNMDANIVKVLVIRMNVNVRICQKS